MLLVVLQRDLLIFKELVKYFYGCGKFNNLKKGDAVSINGFEGKIYDINFRRVILELADEKGRFC